jgi:MYXO-CTERM domain-containing protein
MSGRRRRFLAALLGAQRLQVAAVLLATGVSGGLGGAPVRAAELVSVSINGGAGNGPSSGAAVNQDGSFVTFFSDATNLVRGDTNDARDVFLRDRDGATTERVSVSSAGEEGDRPSHAQGGAPAITAGGQIVAFYSAADNLVPDDTNGQLDVFVRLRATEVTERVSLNADGGQGDGPSIFPSISGDGGLVAFQSQATNLVPGDTNAVADIFVRDRAAGTTERLCDGVQGNRYSITPAISPDGNVVAFASAATNLVPVDANNRVDIFVCDRRTGTIELVSVSSAGVQGNGDSILPAISEDGRFVAFKSVANNLVPSDNNGVVDVFVRDRVAGTTERVSVDRFGGDANDASFPPSISYDGRFVAFGSAATNLVLGDYNQEPSVFVRDRATGTTLLVDVNDQGEQADAGTPDIPPGISGDGKQIGFVSLASNLIPEDLNEQLDVFIAPNPAATTATPTATPTSGTPAPTSPGAPGTPTATPTATPTDTPGTPASTPTSSATLGVTVTPTETPAGNTPTATATATPASVTPTPTNTGTPDTPTATPTVPVTHTPMETPTPGTPAGTPASSPTLSVTATPTDTPTTSTPAAGTPTATPTLTSTSLMPTAAMTSTPTRTVSATHTPELDRDGCQCAVAPAPDRSSARVLVWLAAPAALLLWRRRCL